MMTNAYVAKFGGSSLASARQFRKVAAIIRQDPRRKWIVVSAPGKRFADDAKVTDLLYRCFDLAQAGLDFTPVLDQIARRFSDICQELGLSLDLDAEFAQIAAHLWENPQRDYTASRGEYLNAKLLSAFFGYSLPGCCPGCAFSLRRLL